MARDAVGDIRREGGQLLWAEVWAIEDQLGGY